MVRLWLSLLLLSGAVFADDHDHVYEVAEEVVLWMNTVGPYSNQQERYTYFSLPFCRGKKESIGHYHETMGEELLGVELDFSGLDIKFRTNFPHTVYCKITLTEADVNTFVYAVMNKYSYQMNIDDIPNWGMVGEVDRKNLYTHKKLDVGYNGEQIPWFSIFNSFMMVVFLVGLVWMILVRTLKKDYARYRKDESLDDTEGELCDEYGWKQVHGDVFRAPPMSLFFASLIGLGYHVFAVTIISTVLAIVGEFYTERCSLLCLHLRVLSSPVNGFAGGSKYARFGGTNLIKQETPHESTVTTRRFPLPPAPDPQQKNARYVFRLKEMHPCECENGGVCNRRVRICECPLGFNGARCEIVDREFFAILEAEKTTEKPQQQAEESQREPGTSPSLTIWITYVSVVAAVGLLLLMLRAFAVLASTFYHCDKKKSHPLPAAFDDDCGNIYTLPLPMRPPPYSERCPPLAQSTPCCAKQLLRLQLQPDYLRTLQPLQQQENL